MASLNVSTGAVRVEDATRSIRSRAPSGETSQARCAGVRREQACGHRRRSTPSGRLVYGATGNNYTEPAQTTSDAVMAFEMDTGKVVWSVQLTPNDVFVVGCGANPGPNCPEGVGPDFDFGNAPMLTTVNGKDLIVIGQKSGIGWALDPDRQGAVVWQYRAAKGSALGGMEFGSALDEANAYFPVADTNQPTAGELHAVKLDSGERAWMAPPRPLLCGERGRGCTPAILAAITVIPGVVFAGSQDGGIRAYSTDRRLGALGIRHEPRLQHRERGAGQRRVDQRAWPDRRRRHAFHQFRLRCARRPSRQRAPGLRRSVAVSPIRPRVSCRKRHCRDAGTGRHRLTVLPPR